MAAASGGNGARISDCAERAARAGMGMRPSVLAIAAHPDDIEIGMAGTMLRLAEAGWDLHYFNLSCGNGGSLEMDGEETARQRLARRRRRRRGWARNFMGQWRGIWRLFMGWIC